MALLLDGESPLQKGRVDQPLGKW